MTQEAAAPIGVFDSGIGGLSILRALRAQIPHENFVYYADTAHNPYGDKSEAFVVERSLRVAQLLMSEHRIKALVVACNTATAAAIHVLRQQYPLLPLVGIEPALKPAAALTRTGRVLVLATQGTLQSAKFAALKDAFSAQAEFVCVACEGLAERIEQVVSPLEFDSALRIFYAGYWLIWLKNWANRYPGARLHTLPLDCTDLA
jgi:glutamate racemase